jgi:hypothetical protein
MTLKINRLILVREECEDQSKKLIDVSMEDTRRVCFVSLSKLILHTQLQSWRVPVQNPVLQRLNLPEPMLCLVARSLGCVKYLMVIEFTLL